MVNAKVLLTTTFIASTVFAQGPAPAPIAPPSAGGPGAPADVSVKPWNTRTRLTGDLPVTDLGTCTWNVRIPVASWSDSS